MRHDWGVCLWSPHGPSWRKSFMQLGYLDCISLCEDMQGHVLVAGRHMKLFITVVLITTTKLLPDFLQLLGRGERLQKIGVCVCKEHTVPSLLTVTKFIIIIIIIFKKKKLS